jgi:ribosomal subunit interface protein
MDVRIFFHEMTSSPAMEKKAQDLMQKVYKFLESEREPIYVHITFSAGRPHAHHEVEVRVKSPNYEVMVKREGPQLYALLDEVVDLLYDQLLDAKEKLVRTRRKTDDFKGA